MEMREKEMEMREKEMATREKEMKHQFKMKQLELTALNQNNNNSATEKISKRDLKKFPQFRKGDNSEAFLVLFERACWDYEIKESEKTILLRTQISGELAKIYAHMPQEKAREYEAFKKLVFARFGINVEHLRWKFRALTKKPEETYSQLGANMQRYLEKWLEQAGVENLEDLKNVLGLE